MWLTRCSLFVQQAAESTRVSRDKILRLVFEVEQPKRKQHPVTVTKALNQMPECCRKNRGAFARFMCMRHERQTGNWRDTFTTLAMMLFVSDHVKVSTTIGIVRSHYTKRLRVVISRACRACRNQMFFVFAICFGSVDSWMCQRVLLKLGLSYCSKTEDSKDQNTQSVAFQSVCSRSTLLSNVHSDDTSANFYFLDFVSERDE